MTKRKIDKFAIGYPYPTDYIDILLRKYNFNTKKVHNILCGSRKLVISEIQNIDS